MTDTVTVPREPTEAMLVAGGRAVEDFYSCGGPYPRAKAMYRAMLAAAPKAEPVWAAELEVGRAVYKRIEKLIGTTTGRGDQELRYLSHLVDSVEEVGGYDGPQDVKPEAPNGEQEPYITGVILEGMQGEPAGMMTVEIELSDGSRYPLIRDNGNNIHHWASVRHLTNQTPAPASDELLEALELIARGDVMAFDDELQCDVEVSMDMGEAQEIARAAIANHKGPQ